MNQDELTSDQIDAVGTLAATISRQGIIGPESRDALLTLSSLPEWQQFLGLIDRACKS